MNDITVFADDTVITVINNESSLALFSEELTVVEVGAAGPQGVPGASQGFSNGSAHVEFAWNNITTFPISIITAGKVVIKASIIIMEAFNGTGATLSIGDTGNINRLIGVTDNSPSAVGEYSVSPQVTYGAATQVNLTINPGSGASQGNGLIIIEVQS